MLRILPVYVLLPQKDTDNSVLRSSPAGFHISCMDTYDLGVMLHNYSFTESPFPFRKSTIQDWHHWNRISWLTNCGLAMPYGDIDLDQLWFR